MRNWIDRIAVAVGIAFLLFIIIAPAFAKDDPVSADPIVFLQIGNLGDCTGFAANVLGRQAIVTAGHCAADSIEAHAKVTAKDSLGRVFDVQLLYIDTVHDLAVFGYESGPGTIASAALACHSEVAIGDDVSITGYPLDFGKATTYGKISALGSPMGPWADVLRVNIFAAPGNSGSPVFNKYGEVIGILVGGEPSAMGLSLVVPITQLCRPEIA